MDTESNIETKLLAEIEALRDKCPNTQDIYREVCVLLFFRYGITPTANKLYQLVRKGSMSAPAEALGTFWSDLREKSRVRIEHPDLPEELKTAAGELTSVLWTQAQSLAHESLATLRSEAQAAVAEAKTNEGAAQGQLEAARAEMASVRQALDQATEKIQGFERRLAAEAALRTSLDEQLRLAREDTVSLQRANEEARREFSVELDKFRALGQQAEERLLAAEERSLLEIDRERQAAVKLQKELDTVRGIASQTADRDRAELAACQEQIGSLRQQTGRLEGSLQAVTVAKNQLATELDGVRQIAAAANAQVSLWQTEASQWKERTAKAEKTLAENQPASKQKNHRTKPVRHSESR